MAAALPAALACVVSGGPRAAPPFQYGVHLATRIGDYAHPDGPDTLGELREHHVGWIQMTPFAWQPDTASPEISFRDHTATQTAFIDRVRAEGMHVMMVPHVWSPQFWGEGGRWRGDIRMSGEADWRRWFENYEAFILHYARLSERTGVEMFVLGLEYVQATRERPRDWIDLARKVRQVYSGPIAYGAHYPEEIDAIEFWDDLDLLGVVLYPELSGAPNPSLEELLDGWRPVRERLRRWSAAHGKPVLIVEVGFNSIEGAARRPWEWAREGSRLDLDLQARCYEATFRTLWGEPWVRGIYFWKWDISRRDGGPGNIHYTPRGKPAAEVLSRWFATDPGAGRTVAGSGGRAR